MFGSKEKYYGKGIQTKPEGRRFVAFIKGEYYKIETNETSPEVRQYIRCLLQDEHLHEAWIFGKRYRKYNTEILDERGQLVAKLVSEYRPKQIKHPKHYNPADYPFVETIYNEGEPK